ncbi:hypothetical protein V497_07386 [Pseudogymnoascus sp. VKM F-4516 (FW-969)]|nr:hypothetical protein V497_07386 [Pseudogymnoascus sp. VKM F-4516 (FW-969)]
MCRFLYYIYACGCEDQSPCGIRRCSTYDAIQTLEIAEGNGLHDILTESCDRNVEMGVLRETVDRWCALCIEDANQTSLVAQNEATRLSYLEWLNEDAVLSLEESIIRERITNEEGRWSRGLSFVQDAEWGVTPKRKEATLGTDSTDEWSVNSSELRGASLPGEKTYTEEWSVGDLAEFMEEEEEQGEEHDQKEEWEQNKEQEEEDAKAEEILAEENRQMDEEGKLREEEAAVRYSDAIMAMVYDLRIAAWCNKMLEETNKQERRRAVAAARSAMPAGVQSENARAACMDGAEARDREIAVSLADDVAAGVEVAAAGGSDQRLLVTEDIPTVPAPLESNIHNTLPVTQKLFLRTEREKVVLGLEGIGIIDEVADACKEGLERTWEGCKLYRAVQAATRDKSVGCYQFVSEMVGFYITGFLTRQVIREVLQVLKHGENVVKGEARKAEKITDMLKWTLEAQDKLEVAWATGIGAIDGHQAAIDVGPFAWGLYDAKTPPLSIPGTPLLLNSPQLSNRSSGRGTARGRARGRGRGRGTARGRGGFENLPQVAEDPAEDSVEGVPGSFLWSSNSAPAHQISTFDKSLELNVSSNREGAVDLGAERRREGYNATGSFAGSSKIAEASPVPTLDKSQMVDGSLLGKENRGNVSESMGTHLQASGGTSVGFPQGSKVDQTSLPNYYDAWPQPPLHKSQMVDGSHLGKNNRQSGPVSMGSHLQAPEGIAEGFSQSSNIAQTSAPNYYDAWPQPPLHKSQVVDGSHLGKRNREIAPESKESYMEATEGAAEGSKGPTAFNLDASQIPTRGGRGGRGRGIKRARTK